MVAVANREQGTLTASIQERIPLARQLGIEAIECSPLRVRARFHWTGELCTDVGALHGGALMALADVCGGICAGLNLRRGPRTLRREGDLGPDARDRGDQRLEPHDDQLPPRACGTKSAEKKRSRLPPRSADE